METKHFTKYFTSCKGVFQGGGCKAIAYIGAYKTAYERGVFFSELAGTSAGSIIAALIAAGAKPEYLEKVVKDLDFKTFVGGYKKANYLEICLNKMLLPKPYRRYAKYLSVSGLFQNYGLMDEYTVEKNLHTSLTYRKNTKLSISEALAKVGLDGYDKRLVYELSGRLHLKI